jgi:hypothetical protein
MTRMSWSSDCLMALCESGGLHLALDVVLKVHAHSDTLFTERTGKCRPRKTSEEWCE